MVRRGQKRRTGQTGRERRIPKRACSFVSSASTIALSFYLFLSQGCNYFSKNAASNNDPLLGGAPVPAPAKMGQQQPATPVTVLPPLPAPNTSVSPAVLAAGPPRAFDNSRDLRIGNTVPGNDGWAGRDSTPRAGGSGATLLGVQPDIASRPPSQPPYSTVSLPGSQVSTVEQGIAILKSRGSLWERFEPEADTGRVTFTCALPDRQISSRNHVYRYTAMDQLTAIQAVIQQIESESERK